MAARPGEPSAGAAEAPGGAPPRRRRRPRRFASAVAQQNDVDVGRPPVSAGRLVRADAAAAAPVGARPAAPATTPPLRRPRPHAQPRRPLHLQVLAQLSFGISELQKYPICDLAPKNMRNFNARACRFLRQHFHYSNYAYFTPLLFY